MTLELVTQLAAGDVPKVDGRFGAAERQQPAIRGEGHALVLRPPVGANRQAALLPRLQVPKPECPVLAPGEQGLVVGGEVDLRDVALVSRDAAAFLAVRHVPEADGVQAAPGDQGGPVGGESEREHAPFVIRAGDLTPRLS